MVVFIITACDSRAEDIPKQIQIEEISDKVELNVDINNDYRDIQGFNVSNEQLQTFSKAINEAHVNLYGEPLFNDTNGWDDYGTVTDSRNGKAYQNYVYLEDSRSYLDPDIIVSLEEETGDIHFISVRQSYERQTEHTSELFEMYFMTVAAALLPDFDKTRLEALFSDVRAGQNETSDGTRPYPQTLYYSGDVFCSAYVDWGEEEVYFGVNQSDKLKEYLDNDVNCILIE